jgi:thioredoxin reductase (NADPH)
MGKPIILTADDDPEVLRAISRDLRRKFGQQFQVIRADSGHAALDALQQVKLRSEAVALMLIDQRMPDMTGVELLSEARHLFPQAKRALLTAYADTDAAIRAINDVHLDYYLMKPWDPPEERLYPVLDDMIDDWQAGHRPEFDGVRVLGHRWSPESHAARDFLARNQVPYRWIDLEQDPQAVELQKLTGIAEPRYPVVLFPDGTVLEQPTTQEIAEKVGLRGHAEVPLYDVIIIGAGPAGLAAAVYASSEGLRAVIVEREAAGGQAGMSSRIENYLGFPSGLSGGDLARRAMTQARRFGTEFLLTQEVVKLDNAEGVIGVTLSDGTQISAHALVIATGVAYRRLDVPGVEQLTGRGVYYGAAIAEAVSISGEDVYIVGGANSAGQAAIYFANFAHKVTMLVRGPALSATMSHYLVERIEQAPNIDVRYHTTVESVGGIDRVEALTLRDTATNKCDMVPASALFVFIGAQPLTDWLDGVLMRDEKGFLLTGLDVTAVGRPKDWPLDRDPFLLETSVPGVFAAGDVRHGSGKRVATAVGEGAMAVMSIWQYRAQMGL